MHLAARVVIVNYVYAALLFVSQAKILLSQRRHKVFVDDFFSKLLCDCRNVGYISCNRSVKEDDYRSDA